MELDNILSTCDGIDFGVIPNACPRKGYALNISQHGNLREGDMMASYGYHHDYRGWTGIIGGRYYGGIQSNNHFDELPITSSREYSLLGYQGKMQSGSPALNSVGFIGIIHAIIPNLPVSYLIPHDDIEKCLDKKIREGKLKHISECESTIVQPPVLTLSKVHDLIKHKKKRN